MSISRGEKFLTLDDVLSKVSEAQLLARYLNVIKVPTLISSPFRRDEHPSLSLFSPNGNKIFYKDFATGESGDLINLLGRMWNTTFIGTLKKIMNDTFTNVIPASIDVNTKSKHNTVYKSFTVHRSSTKLEVKTRDWTQQDINYWAFYGVPLVLLKRAHVYPITYYFITKESKTMIFHADKMAYAFIENKENHPTIKVYQPYNKCNAKWINTHDKSVLGLWTLLPEVGDMVCICSSVKDALCLMANTNIPAICLQGEAYGISQTAQNVLRKRFKNVYICLDNDIPGKRNAKKLKENTGFINIELPEFEGGKDISDLYKILNNPNEFKTRILNLFKYNTK